MHNEVNELENKGTWVPVLDSEVQKQGRNALPSTWVFWCKCYPDGSIHKLKACLCMRGDKKFGVDFTETYAPVVQWMTVHLVLVLALALNWVAIQMDYTNDFTQSALNEEVYMEIPQDFMTGDDEHNYVLRLNKSLYGLRQAPLSWLDHLKTHLESRGVTAIKIDPCLFINKSKRIFCLVYIDDIIWITSDQQQIEKVLELLKDELEMTVEVDVTTFFGIQVNCLPSREIQMQQTGLIEKVLNATGLQEWLPDKSPTALKPLGTDKKVSHLQRSGVSLWLLECCCILQQTPIQK